MNFWVSERKTEKVDTLVKVDTLKKRISNKKVCRSVRKSSPPILLMADSGGYYSAGVRFRLCSLLCVLFSVSASMVLFGWGILGAHVVFPRDLFRLRCFWGWWFRICKIFCVIRPLSHVFSLFAYFFCYRSGFSPSLSPALFLGVSCSSGVLVLIRVNVSLTLSLKLGVIQVRSCSLPTDSYRLIESSFCFALLPFASY